MSLTACAQPSPLRRPRFARPRRLLAAALLALLPAQVGLAQERVAVPGTSVSLVPMKSFVPASRFAGLESEDLQASLVVVEMPAVAHPEISKIFADLNTAKTNFAKQNVSIATLDQLKLAAGESIPLATGKQTMGAVRFDKWIALLKGPRTVLLTVQAPETTKLKAQDVRAMITTVSLGAEPTLEQKLDALPFRIRPSEPFRVVDTFGGLGVLMTVGPQDTDPKSEQPMLIASYQTSGQLGQNQLGEAAERLLKTTRGYENAEIARRDEVRFAGSDGLLFSGTHEVSGARKRFVQYMSIGPNARFLRLIASVDEARFASLEPAIKAVAESASFAASR